MLFGRDILALCTDYKKISQKSLNTYLCQKIIGYTYLCYIITIFVKLIDRAN